MPLTIDEARRLGSAKLGVAQSVFDKALQHAKDIAQRPQDVGPLALAMAIMGIAKVRDPKEIESEMVDALQLIDKAEKEWRMEMAVGSLGKTH
jgi:hypothetical protein